MKKRLKDSLKAKVNSLDYGCKYGDEECPVVLRQIEQLYPCEQCSDFPDEDVTKKPFVSAEEIKQFDELFISLDTKYYKDVWEKIKCNL